MPHRDTIGVTGDRNYASKTFGRPEGYWEGFEFALLLLEDMFASTHPHPKNIADCIRAKANRLPKNKIRKTVRPKN